MALTEGAAVRAGPSPDDRRFVSLLLLAGLLVLVPVLAYLLATGDDRRLALAIGAPLWFFVAYRFPMVGIAVLSTGQFLLRTMVGTFAALSRGSTGTDTILVGALLLSPLVAAALLKGDIGRLGRLWSRQRMVMWPLAVITVAVLVGYAVAPTGYGKLKVIAYLGLNLPLFLLTVLLLRNERDARNLVVGAVVVSLLTLAISLLGSSNVWQESALRGTKAVVGQFADQNVDTGIWLARRLAIGGLAAIAVVVMSRTRAHLFYWAAAIALFAGVGLAASRGPAVASVAAVLVMVALAGRGQARPWSRFWIVLGLAIAVMLALAFLPPQFADRYRGAFSLADPSVQGRIANVGPSLRLIGQAPLIGVGLGHYPIALWGVDKIIYPHNLLLELAAELGAPVAIMFLVMVAGTFRAAVVGLVRSVTPWMSAAALWAVGIALASFIDGQVSGDLRTNEHVWFAAGVAVAVAASVGARRLAEPRAGVAPGDDPVVPSRW